MAKCLDYVSAALKTNYRRGGSPFQSHLPNSHNDAGQIKQKICWNSIRLGRQEKFMNKFLFCEKIKKPDFIIGNLFLLIAFSSAGWLYSYSNECKWYLAPLWAATILLGIYALLIITDSIDNRNETEKALPEDDQRNDKKINDDDKIKIEYWKKKLDHTLEHTQKASILIYSIDGVILGIATFLVKEFKEYKEIYFIASFLALILSVITFLHSKFIKNQQYWYNTIDKRLRELLDEKMVDPPPSSKVTRRLFTRSYKILYKIHFIISLALLAIAIFCYYLYLHCPFGCQ